MNLRTKTSVVPAFFGDAKSPCMMSSLVTSVQSVKFLFFTQSLYSYATKQNISTLSVWYGKINSREDNSQYSPVPFGKSLPTADYERVRFAEVIRRSVTTAGELSYVHIHKLGCNNVIHPTI